MWAFEDTLIKICRNNKLLIIRREIKGKLS